MLRDVSFLNINKGSALPDTSSSPDRTPGSQDGLSSRTSLAQDPSPDAPPSHLTFEVLGHIKAQANLAAVAAAAVAGFGDAKTEAGQALGGPLKVEVPFRTRPWKEVGGRRS